jgi:hypothetical protein
MRSPHARHAKASYRGLLCFVFRSITFIIETLLAVLCLSC